MLSGELQLSVTLPLLGQVRLFEILDVLFAELDLASFDSFIPDTMLARVKCCRRAECVDLHSLRLAKADDRHDVLLRHAPSHRDLRHRFSYLLADFFDSIHNHLVDL